MYLHATVCERVCVQERDTWVTTRWNIYMCMYAYIYLLIYIYIYVYVHVYVCLYIYTCLCTYGYKHVHICMHIFIWTYTCSCALKLSGSDACSDIRDSNIFSAKEPYKRALKWRYSWLDSFTCAASLIHMCDMIDEICCILLGLDIYVYVYANKYIQICIDLYV